MFGVKKDRRPDANAAGYMELAGAVKDADCRKVNVAGGVSTQLGCCNEFEPQSDEAQEFRCGRCEYVEGGDAVDGNGREAAHEESGDAGVAAAMERGGEFGARAGGK
jgi:hypothetical protein